MVLFWRWWVKTEQAKDLASGPQLTVAEACGRLRCGRSHLYKLLASGLLPSCKVGRRLVPSAAVEKFLADSMTSSLPEAQQR
jgi:excisionase family DNA binding protein